MTDLFENPMGLDGFEFVEFASPERGLLEPVFEILGFSHVANHKSKDVKLYRQGGINFIINYEKNSPAYFFCGGTWSFCVRNGFSCKKLSSCLLTCP